MNDLTVRIRYDAENGMAIADAKAEATVLAIPHIMGIGKAFSVSTENVILAARTLRKEGKIPGLVLYFGDFELTVDADGRVTEEWPVGFCDHFDNWLSRLM